jgi:hypothetical protein
LKPRETFCGGIPRRISVTFVECVTPTKNFCDVRLVGTRRVVISTHLGRGDGARREVHRADVRPLERVRVVVRAAAGRVAQRERLAVVAAPIGRGRGRRTARAVVGFVVMSRCGDARAAAAVAGRRVPRAALLPPAEAARPVRVGAVRPRRGAAHEHRAGAAVRERRAVRRRGRRAAVVRRGGGGAERPVRASSVGEAPPRAV